MGHNQESLSSTLILPGSLEFESTLGRLPPGWQSQAHHTGDSFGFVADVETGLLRFATGGEMREYVLGGEYEERLDAMGFEVDLEPGLGDCQEFYIDC